SPEGGGPLPFGGGERQTPPSTEPKREPPTPHQDGTNSPGKNTSHHCHCNDSPGRNIIQLSSTIVTQQIQMA
ncbi:hypothetical protein CRENBAI_000325, partial [Crenichthys baileyi]